MSLRRVLVVEDFQPRGPSRWIAVLPLDSPLGQFRVSLRYAPDAGLVAAANAVADYIAEKAETVLAAAHADYVAHSHDEGWMEGCEVPLGLTAAEIRQYLNDPTIAIDRIGTGQVSSVIYFSPQWDQEHGLYLKVLDGRIARTEP